MLFVETPYVRMELTAVGTWKQPVAVSARLLSLRSRVRCRRPITLPCSTRTVDWRKRRLAYCRRRMEGSEQHRSRHVNGRDSQIALQSVQLLMPGLAPITDRERL